MPQIVDHRGAARENTGSRPVDVGASCPAGGSSRLDGLVAPLSAQLRARTACLHRQTEDLLGLPGSIQTHEHYSGWLCRFLGLYWPLEHSLSQFAEWESCGLAHESPNLSDSLAADLAVLGIDPVGVSHAPPAMLPFLPNFAHALGARYVLEGSKLGGLVILRDVETRIGSQIIGATRFFGGCGAPAGPTWPAFKTALDGFGNECPDRRLDVVSGAESVFRAISVWFVPLPGCGS